MHILKNIKMINFCIFLTKGKKRQMVSPQIPQLRNGDKTVPHRLALSVKWDATESKCSINSINPINKSECYDLVLTLHIS